ncbi:MAG: AsmA family protein, partial [Methylococcales bacterium]|nr:AsmA family protein [Methylococcales bacterium]
QKVTDMGPFSLTAKIDSDHKLLQLNKLEIIAGPRENPAIHATGSVKNLIEGSGITINIPFNEQILRQFFSMNAKHTIPLYGNILLSDADGSLGIDALTLKTEDSKIMDIKVQGGINDIIHGEEIILNGSVSIKNLKRAGNIFNLDLPSLGPIEFKGKLTGSNEKSNFTGQMKFNQTEIISKLTVFHLVEQPTIKGSLSIPVLHLQDLGIKANPQKHNQQTQSKKHKGDHFFSSTPIAFDKLHDVNLDLIVDIDKVEGTKYKVDTVDMNILLNKGVLDIHPAKFKYADGQVDASLSITANNPPHLKLKLTGDDIDLNGLMQQTLVPSPIEGNMNLTLDLSTSGHTAHEIASNLDGEIGITLENGLLRRSRYIDAIFLDLIDWLFTFGVTKNETQFDCAIASYTIKQGILNTDLLFLDGPKITVRGEGTIDLDTEKIDIIVNLEKKRFLMNSRVPIHLWGTLPNPKVMPIPYKQAVISVGSYIFTPFVSIPFEALGSVGNLLFEPGEKSSCQERIAKL